MQPILNSDPGRIQTCNRWSRNPVLYSVELRGHNTKVELFYHNNFDFI